MENSQSLVTTIKPAVRNQNRINIFINEKFDFSLDLAQVVDLKLKVGKRLSAQELDKCRKASEFSKLYQRSLEYVLSRPHSIKETRNHLVLARKKRELRKLSSYSDADIEKVITVFIQKGYLDDLKFATYYVENRFQNKGISKKRLRQELVKKGISPETIEQVFAISPRNELDEIKKIIKKKRSKYDDEKLISYLVRQGFDYQQSKSAVYETD